MARRVAVRTTSRNFWSWPCPTDGVFFPPPAPPPRVTGAAVQLSCEHRAAKQQHVLSWDASFGWLEVLECLWPEGGSRQARPAYTEVRVGLWRAAPGWMPACLSFAGGTGGSLRPWPLGLPGSETAPPPGDGKGVPLCKRPFPRVTPSLPLPFSAPRLCHPQCLSLQPVASPLRPGPLQARGEAALLQG